MTADDFVDAWSRTVPERLSRTNGCFESPTPRDGTLLRATGSATVWRIIAGKRAAVTPAPAAVIVDVPPAALSAIPIA